MADRDPGPKKRKGDELDSPPNKEQNVNLTDQKPTPIEEEYGEFEDDYEDDFEEESGEDGGDESTDDEGSGEMNVSEEEQEEQQDAFEILATEKKLEEEIEAAKQSRRVYIPNTGEKNPAGEEQLEYESSAYDMIHFIEMEWPCLSFDVLPDSLGQMRTRFPHTMYLVAGTQAEKRTDNKILLMKLSALCRTREESSDDSGIDLKEEESSGEETDPVLEFKSSIHHFGAVNRIRALPQQPHIVAVMSSDGPATIWDFKRLRQALDEPPPMKMKPAQPLETFKFHHSEGYAIDWNLKTAGRLVSGDGDGKIFLWNPTEDGHWTPDYTPFLSHSSSVEDLQWSPSESDVFASASVDHTIKLWDARRGKTAVASIEAHGSDVNVISWNRKRAFLLVSGGDDGSFRVWDLRKLGEYATAQFAFSWHRGPITSVEWNPNDDSELAVSSEDDSVTIWDLSLTSDDQEDLEVPAQLLFVHQGQQDLKEVHWHKQMPGVLISTASNGFNVFKPNNV